jgi:hypothetical protein
LKRLAELFGLEAEEGLDEASNVAPLDPKSDPTSDPKSDPKSKPKSDPKPKAS